jgi:uncharacterized membrane protein YfcA
VDLVQAAVLASAGLAAGFINTLAGGGSVITLPVLEWVTGSPGVANATNRIGLLLQNVSAVAGYHTGRMVPFRLALRLSVPALLGGILGAWIATRLEPGAMRVALAVAIVFVAVTTVLRNPTTPRLKAPWAEAAFFLIGIYMGFLQAGAGFALLALLVGGMGLDLVRANAAKVLIVLVTTAPALAVFALHRQVYVAEGLVLACGTVSGAWIASRMAIKRGAGWVRIVIVIAALGAVTKLLFFQTGPG